MKPITFGDCAPFVEGDLVGNMEKLLQAAGLADEVSVDERVPTFTTSSDETVVGDKKRKSALFVAYLRHLLAPSVQVYVSGKPIAMTAGARSLTQRFFGSAVMNHPVPKALMADGATIGTLGLHDGRNLREKVMTENAKLEAAIEAAWKDRDTITPATKGEQRDAIEATLAALDSGQLRVAEKKDGGDWYVNQWAKKAVLLGFCIKDMEMQSGGPQGGGWWDKVDSKFMGWGDDDWKAAGFRAVPNCIVRKSAYIAPGAVLMPSFVNLGAYVDEGTMVDTWATVGSCAQIGKNVHLSGGVGIGGVLEPMQAGPTIIEDNCFIGARSEVVEGCIVREGSVLGMGVYIGQSTKIVDRETGEFTYGEVPAGSVVVSGSMPSENGVSLYCAVIVKQVDAQTRSKTSINELLRD